MPIIVQPAAVTIDYSEYEGSPKAEFTPDGFNATRILLCAWADRYTLAQQLQGSVSKTGTVITRYLPAAMPGKVGVHCAGVSVDPFDDGRPMPDGGDTKVATYTTAQLTVRYASGVLDQQDTSDSDADILVQESITGWVEMITLPPQGFRWNNSSGPILKDDEAPAKKVTGFTWRYDMTFVPNVPAAVKTLMGKVNSGVLTSRKLGFTFDPESLLYLPPELGRVTTTEGTGMWRLVYSFKCKDSGWNKFWRNDAQAWQRIVTTAGAVADPYEQGDFTALISI